MVKIIYIISQILIRKKFKMTQRIWLTSDEHYGHGNILGYTNRGQKYSTIEYMNIGLIKEHNSVVKDDDTVYHLGDFVFKDTAYAVSHLKHLNGSHCFIRGNHDKWLVDGDQNGLGALQRAKDELKNQGGDPSKILWVKDYYEIKNKFGFFCLSHFPMLTWYKSNRGSIMTHGHTHSNINYLNDDSVKRIDVGVDSAFEIKGNYEPFSIEEIVELMKNRKTISIDHHE